MFKMLSIVALALLPVPAMASELDPPEGPVVLQVTGAITATNQGGSAAFDRHMLEALQQRETITSTPWYDGKSTFSGPLVSSLLEAVGATGDTAHVTAINGYSADIPLSDFDAAPVILATHLDGDELTVRSKGPLFVIYPFDEHPELYNEAYFGRSVWQVVSIEVR